MRANSLPNLLLVATLTFAMSGCFNDAFQTNKGVEPSSRFDLLIEPDRTLVDGTHFLVDRATGDVWRLDVRDRQSGVWVRLAGGPPDAAVLASGTEAQGDQDR